MSPETRSIQALLEEGFLDPIRIDSLKGDWRNFLRECRVGEDQAPEIALREFLAGAVRDMLATVDVRGLIGLIIPKLRDLRGAGVLDYWSLVGSGAKALASDPIDVPALRMASVTIFWHLNKTPTERKVVNSCLAVLRRAEACLKSLRSCVEQLCKDSTVARSAFKTKTDRERFATEMCVDLDSDIRQITAFKGEITDLDSELSDRREVLLRCETALRGFESQEKVLAYINGGQSRRHTSQPFASEERATYAS